MGLVWHLQRASPSITRTSNLRIQPSGTGAASSRLTVLCLAAEGITFSSNFIIARYRYINHILVAAYSHISNASRLCCLESILFITSRRSDLSSTSKNHQFPQTSIKSSIQNPRILCWEESLFARVHAKTPLLVYVLDFLELRALWK